MCSTYQLNHIVLLCYFKINLLVSHIYLNIRREVIVKILKTFLIHYFQAVLIENLNVIIIFERIIQYAYVYWILAAFYKIKSLYITWLLHRYTVFYSVVT